MGLLLHWLWTLIWLMIYCVSPSPLSEAAGLHDQRLNRLVEVYKPFLCPLSNLFDPKATLFHACYAS